jgi:hypothetical protein
VRRAAHNLSVKAKFCSECGSQTAESGTPEEYRQVTVLLADVVRVALSASLRLASQGPRPAVVGENLPVPAGWVRGCVSGGPG